MYTKSTHVKKYKNIGLRAQNLLTTLSSIVNIIGESLYEHLMSTRILTQKMNKMFNQKKYQIVASPIVYLVYIGVGISCNHIEVDLVHCVSS